PGWSRSAPMTAVNNAFFILPSGDDREHRVRCAIPVRAGIRTIDQQRQLPIGANRRAPGGCRRPTLIDREERGVAPSKSASRGTCCLDSERVAEEATVAGRGTPSRTAGHRWLRAFAGGPAHRRPPAG